MKKKEDQPEEEKCKLLMKKRELRLHKEKAPEKEMDTELKIFPRAGKPNVIETNFMSTFPRPVKRKKKTLLPFFMLVDQTVTLSVL